MLKFENNLVYRVSSRASKAIQRNPVWGWGGSGLVMIVLRGGRERVRMCNPLR